MYGGSPSLERNRQLLVLRLFDGPVLIERWTGRRLELALVNKFLVRHMLIMEVVTNLVHIEITTVNHATNLLKTVAIPPLQAT